MAKLKTRILETTFAVFSLSSVMQSISHINWLFRHFMIVFVLHVCSLLVSLLPVDEQLTLISQLIGYSPANAAIVFEQTVGQNVFYSNPAFVGTANITESSAVTAGSDSKSNTYTLDVTAANNGADIPTFICSIHNVTALTTSDTITITHSDTDAKAVTVHEFSGLAASATLDKTASAEKGGTALSSGNTAEHITWCGWRSIQWPVKNTLGRIRQ